MTDHDLQGLTKAVEGQYDPAALAILADALADASGPARLTILRRWLDGFLEARRLRAGCAGGPLNVLLPSGDFARPETQRIGHSVQFTLRDLAEPEYAAAMEQRVRGDMGIFLLRSLSPGYHYAVHLRRQEVPPSDRGYRLEKLGPEVRFTLSVTPLDGGPLSGG